MCGKNLVRQTQGDRKDEKRERERGVDNGGRKGEPRAYIGYNYCG
jgi:hypothetical protein